MGEPWVPPRKTPQFVWGDADTLVPREMQERLADVILSAELVVYPEVGHTPRWEDPARFSRDLARFTRACQVL